MVLYVDEPIAHLDRVARVAHHLGRDRRSERRVRFGAREARALSARVTIDITHNHSRRAPLTRKGSGRTTHSGAREPWRRRP